jgi:hypothetical protein
MQVQLLLSRITLPWCCFQVQPAACGIIESVYWHNAAYQFLYYKNRLCLNKALYNHLLIIDPALLLYTSLVPGSFIVASCIISGDKRAIQSPISNSYIIIFPGMAG